MDSRANTRFVFLSSVYSFFFFFGMCHIECGLEAEGTR